MKNMQINKTNYMDDFYKTREILSLKYINMPLEDMRLELKKSVDKCVFLIEKYRTDKK